MVPNIENLRGRKTPKRGRNQFCLAIFQERFQHHRSESSLGRISLTLIAALKGLVVALRLEKV